MKFVMRIVVRLDLRDVHIHVSNLVIPAHVHLVNNLSKHGKLGVFDRKLIISLI